jgi:hypothetical protein
MYDSNFMQDIMCSSPHNLLYREVIKAQSKKRLTGGKDGEPLERRGGWATTDDLFSMGPPMYKKIVSLVVFGSNDEISKEDLPKARTAIEKTNGVIVTKREEWCDGFLVTPFDGCKAINRNSLYKVRAEYASYNVLAT